MVFKSTAQKMKFSIKDFFIKSDQIRSYGKLYFFLQRSFISPWGWSRDSYGYFAKNQKQVLIDVLQNSCC